MKISVALFASARELVGSNSIDLILNPAATVGELRHRLIEKHPELANLIARSLFSVDHEFANDDLKLSEDTEVAMIPPVSGG